MADSRPRLVSEEDIARVLCVEQWPAGLAEALGRKLTAGAIERERWDVARVICNLVADRRRDEDNKVAKLIAAARATTTCQGLDNLCAALEDLRHTLSAFDGEQK